MRKRVVAGVLVAIIAGLWAVAPYITGLWVEPAFRDNLDALSGHPRIDIEPIAYERGWLRSRARSRLTLSTPEQEVTFRLRHRIAHGPTFSLLALARITTTPVIPPERTQVAAHYFGDQAPFKSQLRIAFTGSQHLNVSSPAFHGPLHNDTATKVDWQGLSGHGTVSRDHDRFQFEFSAPGLAVNGSDGEIDLSGLSGRTTMRKRAEHLWLGDSRLGVDSLRTNLPAEAGGGRLRARLQGLTLDTSVAEGQAEDLLRLTADWDAQSAQWEGRSFNNIALGLELRRIDRAAYRELQARARELQNRALSRDEFTGTQLDLVRDLLPRFLARSPELAVTRLALETEDGALEGSAEASYRGSPEPRGMPANINQVLQRLTARARMQLDKTLLTALLQTTAETTLAAKEGVTPEQAAQKAPQVARMRLGMLQGMGIVKADGDRFTVDAGWEEGTVTVNGKPLGMGMDAPAGP